ncbi:NAD(P)-binding Rossmann-fold superfamily protein [Actinidia rufa]|uniref:NAD(P)-binding Rossmann-fold superfamily protein n=1 Tax=Actinidia rufa TaxID=165716 RepID=A0A7J0EMA5_9ERIC|nr:NAD(P)-binding Rossmann-fold superfamily protein [Actinidia rufa]
MQIHKLCPRLEAKKGTTLVLRDLRKAKSIEAWERNEQWNVVTILGVIIPVEGGGAGQDDSSRVAVCGR